MEDGIPALEMDPYPSSVLPTPMNRKTVWVMVCAFLTILVVMWVFFSLLLIPIGLNRIAINDLRTELDDCRAEMEDMGELVVEIEDYVIVLGEKIEELFRYNRDMCLDAYVDRYLVEHPNVLSNSTLSYQETITQLILPLAEEECDAHHDMFHY